MECVRVDLEEEEENDWAKSDFPMRNFFLKLTKKLKQKEISDGDDWKSVNDDSVELDFGLRIFYFILKINRALNFLNKNLINIYTSF